MIRQLLWGALACASFVCALNAAWNVADGVYFQRTPEARERGTAFRLLAAGLFALTVAFAAVASLFT